MKYYSVLDVTPTTDTWIPNYIGAANKLVTKYGGTYLARTATHEQFEGQNNEAALRIILEWPSKQAALDFMNDPEYVPHLKARTAGSISHRCPSEGRGWRGLGSCSSPGLTYYFVCILQKRDTHNSCLTGSFLRHS